VFLPDVFAVSAAVGVTFQRRQNRANVILNFLAGVGELGEGPLQDLLKKRCFADAKVCSILDHIFWGVLKTYE
jgi:hypothetical protein